MDNIKDIENKINTVEENIFFEDINDWYKHIEEIDKQKEIK